MRLTLEQRVAAETAEQYASVQAGPGTGKSTVIAARAAHLIYRGVEPRRILVLCFTRSGAASVRRKVQEATGQEPTCETFDSYAVRLLTDCGAMDGLQIATDLELETAIRGLYEGDNRLGSKDACNISSLRRAIMHHQSGKHEVHGLEGQTMATLSLRLSEVGRKPLYEVVPDVLGEVQHNAEPYDHVLVDERQDVTPNEETLAVHAMSSDGSLFCVGDAAQAIMGFRGSQDNNFDSLKPARYTLTESFRFGSEIAEAVNLVGRTLDVPDVIGSGPDGCVISIPPDEDWFDGNDPDELLLAPTNLECRNLEQRGLGVHVKRDSWASYLEPRDPFETARELGKAAISTYHMARGREADSVGVFGEPRDARLTYVALSRAQKTLVIVE